ncbi:SIS domain-containing protein [Candidatus Falkowbacteria bacterium]|nr:SIS domain-containing protein [Candidatus Falkowbacteria bacterium]
MITPQQIKKLDKSNLLGSIELLGEQCEAAWREVKKIKIPAAYRGVENIVVSGMGGSALGGHLIQTLFADQLKKPLEIVRGYSLPAYVGPKTLLILSSYSGNTEETLATAREGQKRKAKILGLATGGALANFLRRNNYPAYIFKPTYNPSNQPRMGLGYSIFGQLGFLARCGLLKIEEKEINQAIALLNHKNGTAKTFAQKLQNKIPIIVASEFLLGNGHIMANQINENAKCFAAYFELPELNHHLMEGLKNPSANKNIKFVLINSNLYHPRNQKRYLILKEVLRRNKIDFVEYRPKAKTKLQQSTETLLFGSYTSFYLAMIYNLDPSPIPWVDFFKKQLG